MPFQRKGVWRSQFYEVDPSTGARRRFRRSFGPEVKSRRDADAREREFRTEIRAEMARAARPAAERAKDEPPRAAFSGFARLWLDTFVKVKRKPSVFIRYDSICRVHLVPHFGDRQLATLGNFDVEQLLAKCARARHPDTGRPLAAKTVNEIVGCLSSMLATAVRWRYIAANPCSGVERLELPPDAREFRFYTADQTDVWLEKCAEIEPAWYPLFLAGFRAGLRLGELFALELGDLDFVSGVIHVRKSFTRDATTTPKSGKARAVDMAPSLAEVLPHYRHLRGPLVFCSADGRHLNRDMLKHPWARVTAAAGLPLLRPHDMRHSFASQLVIAGVPLRAVQEMLGHATIQMTQRYSHLAPGATRQFVALLDRSKTASGHIPGTPVSTGGPSRRNHMRKMVGGGGSRTPGEPEDRMRIYAVFPGGTRFRQLNGVSSGEPRDGGRTGSGHAPGTRGIG